LSSPAIDAGSSSFGSYPSSDINGLVRSGNPDIGANEYWLSPISFSFNGVNYEIIKVGATWTGAAEIAVSRNGKLVEIESVEEQNAIFSAIGSAGLNASDTVAADGGGGAYLWIGGNDIAAEGSWVWDGDNDLSTESFWSGTYEGTAIADSYVNWGTTFSVQNEPDDYQTQQDALAISLDGWPLGSAGQWNDVDQTNLLYSIVEYNVAPTFTSGSTFSVQENQTIVGQIVAVDPNGEGVLYSIQGGADQNLFSIHSVTGELSFLQAPDYEIPGDSGADNQYDLTVQTSDGSLTATQHITVTITDTNEGSPNQAPTGLDHLSGLSVLENQASGTIVGTFQAQDPDGDLLGYYLVSGSGDGNNSMFTMDTNGTLRTAMSFDYESYQSLNIRVAVLDDNNASDEGAFSVVVTNVNEAPNGLDHLSGLSVLENQASGTIVGTFQAIDPDGNDLSYYLTSGSGDGNNSMFTMDTNGTLRTAVSFDYESYQSLNIRVRAMDGNSSSVEGAFAVIVGNENEAPNTLDHLSGLSVLENQVSGTIVGTFQAIDPDGDDLSYHLVSGSGDGNNSMFTMDTNGTLRTAVSFDYESYQSLNIRVRAMDGNSSSVEGAFTVIVGNENEAPNTLDHLSGLSVLENQSSGTIVGTFQAIDPDGDDLSYHLVSGSGDGNNSMFTMDTNGTLRTAVSFDYESYQSLSVRVKAMDGNDSSVEGSFSVAVTNVNDAPNTLDHSSALSVLENQASGTIVGTFQAIDPDGDSLSYYLASGSGDENNSMFTMDTNGTLRTAVSFDYESYQSLNIRVRAMDGNSSSVEGAFTVVILNDLGSVFSVSGGSFSHPFYQFVDGNGLAVDFSSHQLSRGEIYEFKADGVLNSHPFMIGESNGDLSSSLVSGGPLTGSLGSIFLTIPSDFSGSLYYFCTAHTSMVAPIGFNTGNQAPMNLTHLSALSVLENQASGTIVGTFTAQDPDGDALTYHLTSGIGDGNNSMFSVETNGTLLTAMSFDYESYQSLSVRVKAMDGNDSSVEGSFSVSVTNVNEAPNSLNHSSALSVLENQASGTVVGNFHAQDPDGDDLSYYLTSGLGDGNNSMFTLETNGTLRTALSFDYESFQSLTIRAGVVDEHNASDEGTFTISIVDQNETVPNSVPTDLSVLGNLEILENQPIGSFICEFNATDLDGDLLSYYLVNGDGDINNEMFTLDQNGTLRTNQIFDYESNVVLSIRVQVTDNKSGTISEKFIVKILDEDDLTTNEPPRDLNSTEELIVEENRPVGTIVGQFQALDPEGTILNYFLTDDAGIYDNDSFVLETNGTLKTAVEFDFENQNTLTIRVAVQDLSNSYITEVFNVEIVDVNETTPNAAPVNLRALDNLEVEENQPIGSFVGEFNASDPEGGEVFFFLTSGEGDDHNTLFYIFGNQLITNSVFDYAQFPSLTVRVGVMDESNVITDANFTITILESTAEPVNLPPTDLLAITELGFSNNSEGRCCDWRI
jgi:hypothetical protein